MSQTPQMDVLYLLGVGQIICTFTRAAEPAQIETDTTPFVGDGMHVRGLLATGQDLVIPPSLIGIFRTDRDFRQIFQRPFATYAKLPPGGAPVLAGATSTGTAPTFSSPKLTVTLSPPNTEILILALDKAGGPVVTFNPPLTQNQGSVDVPMIGLNSLHTYNAFVFVPTFNVKIISFPAP